MTGRRRCTLAGPKCAFEENRRIGRGPAAAGRSRVSPGRLHRYANHLDSIGQIGRIGLIRPYGLLRYAYAPHSPTNLPFAVSLPVRF
ncbi:MAG: hypothetical protein QOH31_138 [Verrucomicrobiota bacterium]